MLFITSFGQQDPTTTATNRDDDDEAKQNEFLSCLGRGKVQLDTSLDQSRISNLKRLKQNVARSSTSRSRSRSPTTTTTTIDTNKNNHRNELVLSFSLIIREKKRNFLSLVINYLLEMLINFT